MNGHPNAAAGLDTPQTASRGKILMMAIVAGAVITNVYCTQPSCP